VQRNPAGFAIRVRVTSNVRASRKPHPRVLLHAECRYFHSFVCARHSLRIRIPSNELHTWV